MHSLWLVRVDENQRTTAVKAVKEARTILGDLIGATTSSSWPVVRAVVNGSGPQIVGQHPDYDLIQKAGQALAKGGMVALDLSPEDALRIAGDESQAPAMPASPPAKPDVPEPTPEAYRTALVLMAASNGNPLQTFVNARALGMHSPHPEHYRMVQRLCHETWPHLTGVLQQHGVSADPQ